MGPNEQAFETLSKAPEFLTKLDSLGIPGWALGLAIIVASIGLLFALRELAAWFLKTNSIADEVIRLETMIKDLQGDIHALEQAVLKTKLAVEPGMKVDFKSESQSVVESSAELVAPSTTSGDAESRATTAHFPLHH